MNLNNFQIIFNDNATVFIQTNASKKTTTQLLTKYIILKKFQLEELNLIEFFDAHNYIVKYLPRHFVGISNIISTKNYMIIDLSHLDQSISKVFYSSSFNSTSSKI